MVLKIILESKVRKKFDGEVGWRKGKKLKWRSFVLNKLENII